MARTLIRFPKLYSRAVGLLNVELKPSHFFDLLILSLVALAFIVSTMTMGVVSQANSDLAPRLLFGALALHLMAQVARSDKGVRIRWAGLLFLPFAFWVLFDKSDHGTAWRAREQFVVAICAITAFWVVLHHMRHPVHRWFLIGVIGATASVFGALMLSSDKNLLPRMAMRAMDSSIYGDRLSGPFGTPGLFAAFLQLCIFPVAAVMIAPTGVSSRRLAAAIAVIFGMIGLGGCQHGPAWYGFCAGAAVLSWFLIGKRLKAGIMAACFAGFGFFVPKLGLFDTGLFRHIQLTNTTRLTPLADTSIALLRTHPLTGIGSGGFASAFESVRPPAWSIDPSSAGGFFHQLAAENGAVGLLLFIVPAAAIWFLGLRLCMRTPRRETPAKYDPSKDTMHRSTKHVPRKTPEIRVALAGMLAGSLAAGITLAADYPGPSISIALVFAIFAATTVRLTENGRLVQTLEARPKPNLILRGLVAAAPVIALIAVTYPVFESSQKAALAENLVKDAENASLAGQRAIVIAGYRLAAVAQAQGACRRALELEPDNARAARALAAAHIAQLHFSGKDPYFGEGVAAARLAANLAGNEVAPALPLVSLLRGIGDKAGAEKHLRDLHTRAPANIPVTLEIARTLLDKGETMQAVALLNEVLAADPWNNEAKRVLALAGMNTEKSSR